LDTGSEIKIHDQFTPDQCHDFRNLRDHLPVFGIVGDTRAPAQSPSVPLGVLNRIWLDLMPAFLA
jgi:hypothetical protein